MQSTFNKKEAARIRIPVIEFEKRSWCEALYRPCRIKMLCGKEECSTAFAEVAIWWACTRKNQSVVCAREFLQHGDNSFRDKIMSVIREYAIPLFDLQKPGIDFIKHKATGSRIFFRGLEQNREKIKTWGNVNVVWVDDAHTMLPVSWNQLTDYIKAPESELWISFRQQERPAVFMVQ